MDNTSDRHIPRSIHYAVGAALIAQFILIWTTFFILSSTIHWPASLDDPASIALPRLLENESAVLIGYSFYLLAALLMIPATVVLNMRLRIGGSVSGFTLSLAIGTALAKVVGISRWLFAMPNLARAFVEEGSDQTGISNLFNVLNDYAGGIGEVIGVGLGGGLWTITFGLLIWQSGERLCRFVGGFALLAGASLFLTIPAGFGVEMGPVLTINNIAWQFSLLAIAIWSLRSPRSIEK